LRSSHVYEAALTYAIAMRSRQIQLPHQDPADRFIAATAIEYAFPLITADEHLLKFSQLTTIAAN
jgi:PIN domain nuclease of toxin-antitoxin system